MFSKKITRVVVLTLVIVFMFSSVAFSSDNVIRDFIKNAMEKVFINGVEVPHIKQDNVIYVPVDTLALTGARMKQEISGLKVDILYDTDTAYKELKAIYDRHIERVQNPISKNVGEARKLYDERNKMVFADIVYLDTIQIQYQQREIDTKLAIAKMFLHSVLNNEFMLYTETLAALNDDRDAKNRIKDMESAFIMYGTYASGSMKSLDDAYEEFKEAK